MPTCPCAVSTVIPIALLATVAAALEPPPQRFVLQLDRINHLVAAYPEGLARPEALTIELWINPRDGAPLADFLVAREPSGSVPVELWWDEAGHRLVYQYVTLPETPPGKWTHLALTHAPGVLAVYRDGVLAFQQPWDDPPAVAPGSTLHLVGTSGTIRQLRLWSRALAEAEVAQVAATAVTGSEPGLAAAWPFDDGWGDTMRGVGPMAAPFAIAPEYNASGRPRWVRTAVVDDPYYSVTGTDLGVDYIAQATLADLDDDADLDLLLWAGGSPTFAPLPLRAWRNDGPGVLAEATAALITPGESRVQAPLDLEWGDLDGDGRDDLLVADYGPDAPPYPGGQSRVLMRRPDGGLHDETAARVPEGLLGAFGSTLLDVDEDGDLDAFLVLFRAGQVSPFLVNDGSGHFTADTARFPAAATDCAYLSHAFLDADNDGDQDLYVGFAGDLVNPVADLTRDRLLLNDGTGHFTLPAASPLAPRYRGLYWVPDGAAAGDFDGDGWQDLAVNAFYGYGEKSRFVLYLNNQDGTFRDGSAGLPQFQQNGGGYLDLHARDVNGDGLLDLVATKGDFNIVHEKLFLNTGGARFLDASEALPIGTGWLLPGDVDADGLLDFLAFPFWSTSVLTLTGVRPLAVATWGDFSLGVHPGEIDVPVGGSRTAAVTVVRGGFTGPITLEATTTAPGLGLQLTDTELTGDEQAELILAPAAGATPGTHRVTITARSGEAFHAGELIVYVQRNLGRVVRGTPGGV